MCLEVSLKMAFAVVIHNYLSFNWFIYSDIHEGQFSQIETMKYKTAGGKESNKRKRWRVFRSEKFKFQKGRGIRKRNRRTGKLEIGDGKSKSSRSWTPSGQSYPQRPRRISKEAKGEMVKSSFGAFLLFIYFFSFFLISVEAVILERKIGKKEEKFRNQ